LVKPVPQFLPTVETLVVHLVALRLVHQVAAVLAQPVALGLAQLAALVATGQT
jgi:hypothetical protein